jgi:hypothetical protein
MKKITAKWGSKSKRRNNIPKSLMNRFDIFRVNNLRIIEANRFIKNVQRNSKLQAKLSKYNKRNIFLKYSYFDKTQKMRRVSYASLDTKNNLITVFDKNNSKKIINILEKILKCEINKLN